VTMPEYRRPPRNVLAAVESGLRNLGVSRLYGSACPLVGVLPVARGVTAWCDGRTLRWSHGGTETRWPIADAQGAAEQLAELAKVASP
jgi:hypothetical protein